MTQRTSIEEEILTGMRKRRPDLEQCIPSLLALHQALVRCYDAGGKLLVCGNGGSHADSLHIVGELCKSFERKRPIPEQMTGQLKGLPFGEDLAQHLEAGLAAIALGISGPLKTAVENDSPLRDIGFAQETFALIKPEDVFMGISTSGNAANCTMAMSVAKASGAATASLTGPKGGKMAALADIAVKAPGDSVKVIQEAHLTLYHTMCALIEAHYFPEMRT
ncbi:MAG: SIS domain-containing protein [Candidatus Hydrogenedentes bacterium]|nr:SIS domain-containing protein [Candidatus Hydrogenedentota bacterium]